MQVSDSELSEHHNNGYPTITLFCAIPINILLRDLRNTIFTPNFQTEILKTRFHELFLSKNDYA